MKAMSGDDPVMVAMVDTAGKVASVALPATLAAIAGLVGCLMIGKRVGLS